MTAEIAPQERSSRAIRAWLLALLRFAVTLDDADRLTVLAIASEIDKPSSNHLSGSRFKFFHTTSAELCGAILDPQTSSNRSILQRHLARTGDERLNRAFAAALELDRRAPRPANKSLEDRLDLWKGLRRAGLR